MKITCNYVCTDSPPNAVLCHPLASIPEKPNAPWICFGASCCTVSDVQLQELLKADAQHQLCNASCDTEETGLEWFV